MWAGGREIYKPHGIDENCSFLGGHRPSGSQAKRLCIWVLLRPQSSSIDRFTCPPHRDWAIVFAIRSHPTWHKPWITSLPLSLAPIRPYMKTGHIKKIYIFRPAKCVTAGAMPSLLTGYCREFGNENIHNDAVMGVIMWCRFRIDVMGRDCLCSVCVCFTIVRSADRALLYMANPSSLG